MYEGFEWYEWALIAIIVVAFGKIIIVLSAPW